MKTAVAAALLVLATAQINSASAADYEIRTRPHIAADGRGYGPICYRSRYAYVRYAPVLATALYVRPVIVSEPTTCVIRSVLN